jgi:hypothetical protein
MNDSESETLSPVRPALSQPSVQHLQQQVESLRGLLIGALMALFLLSVAVNLFLFRQDSLVRKELAAARTASRNMLSDYETNKRPLIQAFVSKLQDYAKTHPDFNPVLQKYNLSPSNSPAQTGQPSASPPAPAPSKSP